MISKIITLRCLDYRRCGKQRVESKQILDVLQGRTSAWKNHPIVKMWQGYESALIVYYNCNLREWSRRGYKNIKLQSIVEADSYDLPYWFNNKEFHDSHKSNLLRKNYIYYSQFNWNVDINLPYIYI